LNSSRAAPRVGISVTLQQAAGNSNLKFSSWGYNQIDLVILLKSFHK
jgi:molybdate-binding protein